MTDKKAYLFRKQRGKEFMTRYIAELDALLNSAIGAYLVKGIDETDVIMQSSQENISTTPIKKIKEKFELKNALLANIFKQCDDHLSGEVYLWTSYSSDCGIAQIDSILMINPAFKYKAEHSGMFVVVSKDLHNKLLFDFYEEEGENFIEIEVFGNEWGRIQVDHIS